MRTSRGSFHFRTHWKVTHLPNMSSTFDVTTLVFMGTGEVGGGGGGGGGLSKSLPKFLGRKMHCRDAVFTCTAEYLVFLK